MKKKILFPVLILMMVIMACNFSAGTVAETAVPTAVVAPVENTPVEVKPADTEVPKSGAVDNIDDVQGAVFQIIGTGTINDVDQGEMLNAEWGGTGFFIDSSGIGVTNNHVVCWGSTAQSLCKWREIRHVTFVFWAHPNVLIWLSYR